MKHLIIVLLLAFTSLQAKTQVKMRICSDSLPKEDSIYYFWFSERIHKMRTISGKSLFFVNGKEFTEMADIPIPTRSNDTKLVFVWQRGKNHFEITVLPGLLVNNQYTYMH